MRYIRHPLPADHSPGTGHKHTVVVGRTSVSWQRWPTPWPPRRFTGGQATPGPWTSWYLPWLGEVTVSHDRTLFGWDNQP